NSLRSTALGVQRAAVALHGGRAAEPALPPGIAVQAVRRIFDLGRGRAPAQGSERLGRLLLRTPKPVLGQERGVFQLLGAAGKVLVTPGAGLTPLPVNAHTR